MEKKKAILKIESYSTKAGTLLLSVSDFGVRSMLKGLVELCMGKHDGYMQAEFSPPYKARSTGKGSQNNKIWQMITEIANETGNELGDVEDYVKIRACTRGYPYKVNKLTGAIKPESMANISTVEAGYLIDELYVLGAEYGISFE